jgi:hypothetical protein
MESDIFRAGVAPGSPSTDIEIKMLLCHLLSHLEEPIHFTQLHEALSEHSLVNYFELVQALDDLCQLGQLSVCDEQGTQQYRITSLGREIGAEFERTLPLSMREKALDSTRRVLERHRRLTEVNIKETPCPAGGFLLELSIPDKDGELIGLRVFAPTRQECDLMKKRFLNAPLTIYKGVMALLTGNEQVLGTIFSDERKLF